MPRGTRKSRESQILCAAKCQVKDRLPFLVIAGRGLQDPANMFGKFQGGHEFGGLRCLSYNDSPGKMPASRLNPELAASGPRSAQVVIASEIRKDLSRTETTSDVFNGMAA